MKLKANDPNKKRWHNLNILNDFQQHCKDIDVLVICGFCYAYSGMATPKTKRKSVVVNGAKECGISSSTWEARVQKMRKMRLINFEAMT